MKKLVGVSLFVFWAIVVALLVAGLVFYQNNKSSSSLPGQTGNAGSLGVVGTTTLNMVEVAKHSSLSDCWLLISGQVYNVSNYLTAHPGGVGTISPYCGKEATTNFQTKDKGSAHSSYAYQLLNNYLLGSLNQTVGQQQLQNNINQTNSLTPPAGGRRDD